jgi:superfamily II DNA or RNA helicase
MVGASTEGLDFKNIRQIHILDPWYNMNRIEQIIGRGVRNLSHCSLPFEERNVEIYLHGTLPLNGEEPADLYVYRLAEKKALQIGKVTRLLKETAVDCLLNIGQTNFTVEKLLSLAENQNIKLNLSSQKTIDYKIGDKPFTDICDYMESCDFTCSPNIEINEGDIIKDTYNNDFVKMNYPMILKRIRQLYREQFFYDKDTLISSINIVKEYPREQIYYTLSQIIDNKNEYICSRGYSFLLSIIPNNR